MNALRVVYFGTPDFAVDGLQRILESDHNLVGVVTAPDKPSGRGQKLLETAVKKAAKAHDIPVFQPVNLKSKAFLAQLYKLKADIFVVVAFRMLPKAVWKMPFYGTFNLHASLLPDYRGAAPINWAIINGENRTGVTTFFIDEKIDTGNMLFQEAIPVDATDTAGSLHDKLMILGGRLILKTINRIALGKTITIPQQHSNKEAPKIFRPQCQIRWQQPLERIYDFIRGLSPYPTAWSVLENEEETLTVKIYKATPIADTHHHKIGQVICRKKAILVAVSGGFLSLDTLQFPNKKPLSAKAILNGYTLHPSCKMQCP